MRELLPSILARVACSERRACKILGLHRKTARYRPRPRLPSPGVEAALQDVFRRHRGSGTARPRSWSTGSSRTGVSQRSASAKSVGCAESFA